MGKKKAGPFLDLPDESEDVPGDAAATEESAGAPAKQPGAKKAGKKDKKGKAGKGKGGFDSDKDEDTVLSLSAAQPDDEPEPLAAVSSRPRKGKAAKAKPAAAAAFDLLGGEDGADEDANGLDHEDNSTATTLEVVAAADESESKEDPTSQPRITIGEVVSAQPHPKAGDKLKVVEVSTGRATYKVITNAMNTKRGMLVAFAPVGVTTATGLAVSKRTLKGIDSFGMLCSAADVGWEGPADQLLILPDDSIVGAPVPDDPPAELGLSRASKVLTAAVAAAAVNGHAAAPSAAAAAVVDAEQETEAVAESSGKKPKKGKGKKDTSALFAALADAEDPQVPISEANGAAAAESEPVELQVSKKKGKKKGSDAATSLFAALEGADGPAAAEPDTAVESEPVLDAEAAQAIKKKKKKVAPSDLFAALAEDVVAAEVPAAAVPETGPSQPDEPAAGKKKKKKKGDDSLFEAAVEDPALPAPPPTADTPPAPAAPAGKKGKGGKAGPAAVTAAAPDPELDALLAELDAPKAAEQAGAGGKKGKKKKAGKGGDKGEEEDLDALLAAIDGPKAAAAAGPPAAAASPAAAEGSAAAAPAVLAPADKAAAAADDDDDDGEGGEDLEALAASGKELSAAQKKKLKKKQKDKEKKAATKAGEGEEAGAGAAGAAPTKGGKPVKESAIARRIREELERRQKAEEEARRAEEERRAAEEAEIKRMEEEEAKKAEDRRLKKEKEKAKREQLRKEGKLLTGKAKAEAERLAAMRAQLLKQAEDKGIVLDSVASGDAGGAAAAEEAEANDAAAQAAKPKKVVYGTKKPQKKKDDDAAKAAEEASKQQQEQQRQTEQAAAAAAVQAAEAAAAQAAAQAAAEAEAAEATQQAAAANGAAEDGGDDWEAAADDWEALDLDAVKLPVKASSPEPAPAAAGAQAASTTQAAVPIAATPTASTGKAVTVPAADAKAQAAVDEDDDSQEEASGDSDSDASASSDSDSEAGSGSGSESDSDSDSDGDSDSEEDSDDSESESDDDSDEDSSDDESSEYSMDEQEKREARIDAAREKRLQRAALARKHASKEQLRSPICCILGHVDVGKTKILDNIRRTSVQEGEAGGITQQIGATFVPADAIEKRTESLRTGRDFANKLPGLLVIDTPGHESFTNLRARGSGLCDIAVLIVDLMHGLEQQTIESINLLKMRKTPFIIALNKIDRLYGWKSAPDAPVRDSFKRQKEFVMTEFEQRSSQVFLQLNEQGLNVALYWKNTDPRKYVNIVPTSAITGEGIPDLLQLMVKLTQTMMSDRLMYVDNTECTVLEVKNMEGLGTTVDCVLVNGRLKEGDRIVVCGLGGAIVTRIKALKTPQVLKEMRVKGALMDHKEIRAAMGVKVVAPGLEHAVAGTSMYVVGPDDSEEELKDAVMADMADIFSKVDKGGEGVCVQASTLGSLEALLTFLDSPEVNIPVSGINIGTVHKKDVLRANVMNEKKAQKYAVILAFDVPVGKEAKELAEEYGVKIFTADVIYHLFDQFKAYVQQFKAQEQEAARFVAVFPCVLKIIPTCIFCRKDPIVLGVEVVEGQAKVGTPICVPTKDGVDLGRIASMELNHKAVDVAKTGQNVAMKIESTNATEQSRMFGRHFDQNDQLVSRITRESIDALKQHFQDDMTKDDWRLVIKLKKTFQIT